MDSQAENKIKYNHYYYAPSKISAINFLNDRNDKSIYLIVFGNVHMISLSTFKLMCKSEKEKKIINCYVKFLKLVKYEIVPSTFGIFLYLLSACKVLNLQFQNILIQIKQSTSPGKNYAISTYRILS